MSDTRAQPQFSSQQTSVQKAEWEQHLTDQLLFQNNILQNVRESIIVTDLQGTISYWNKEATHIFGYQAEEMPGKTPLLLYSDMDQQQKEAIPMPDSPKKIIIVDDDADILEALQAMLEDEGYSVVTTDRGEEVVKLSHLELPDLILLDMLLSGNDGRKIVRQLRSQESTRNIPILMLSAHPGAEKDAQASEVNGFLAKPFEMEDLLAKVAQYV